MLKRKATLNLVSACIAALMLLACSPPFPRELLEKVEKNVPYTALQKVPEKYAGKLLMLGGTIVDTKNQKEGTRIEVLQKPLDGEGRPELTDETGGRFMVVTHQFLDSAVYHRGRMVTVIGEAAAPQVLPLGEIEYRYPVLVAKGLHLWSPYSGPHFSFGVGVYRGF
jgi:outer membrane lipoprotein